MPLTVIVYDWFASGTLEQLEHIPLLQVALGQSSSLPHVRMLPTSTVHVPSA
jgi:hypothetical protein